MRLCARGKSEPTLAFIQMSCNVLIVKNFYKFKTFSKHQVQVQSCLIEIRRLAIIISIKFKSTLLLLGLELGWFFMCQTLNHESRSQWPLQMVLKENMVLIFLTYEKLLIIFSMKNGFKRKELSHYQRQAF